MIEKFIVGNQRITVDIEDTGSRYYFKFPFHRPLMEEIKVMQGAKWHGFDEKNPRKVWSVTKSIRNEFQLAYLRGENPYAPYDIPIVKYASRRTDPSPYDHQLEMTGHGLTVHYGIWGAEMGTGKTLSAIMLMEAGTARRWWWVGPKNSLYSVRIEFRNWKALVIPEFMSYEQLVKIVANWPAGQPAPEGLILDESSRIKNPAAQRSQAALHLANAIRAEHGKNGYVIEMSGSPAPKSPVDWWHQCEVACPGYLKEGDIYKFKNRLGIVTKDTSITGGNFARVIAWKDSTDKCQVCGLPKTDDVHDVKQIVNQEGSLFHEFEPCFNEVQHLYARMKGLVYVKFKKDCLTLPEKVYTLLNCNPNQEILDAARLIATTAKSTIQALTLMRELSDGFQYRNEKTDVGPCEGHQGPQCPHCHGTGRKYKIVQSITRVACPKDEQVVLQLENHDEGNRLILYAGFTESIDRCVDICHKNTWHTVRVDGRGWAYDGSGGTNPEQLLELFQSDSDQRICIVGHPASLGLGTTLTASPSEVYFSNDFNAESRIQSEDRIHRPSSRGANIFDIIHLPSDLYVRDNLFKKRDLQAMTLGDLQNIYKVIEGQERSV